MKCKNCSYENPAGRTVCLICGEPLPEETSQSTVEETIVMGPGATAKASPPPPIEKPVEQTIKIEPKSVPIPVAPKSAPVPPPSATAPAPKPASARAPAPNPPVQQKSQPPKPVVPQKSPVAAPPAPPAKSRPKVLPKVIIIFLIGVGTYFGYDWWQYESKAGKILRNSRDFADCQKQFSQITDEKFVRRCLTNKSEWLKSAAIRRAAEIGLTDISGVVKKELNSPNSELVLTQSLLALGMVGTNQDVPLISRFLKNNNSEVRLAAVEAIKLLGQEKDFSVLIPLLSDKAENIRLTVVELIKQKKSLAESVDLITLLEQEASPKVIAELLTIVAERNQFNPQLLDVLLSRMEAADFQTIISSFIVANQNGISDVFRQNYSSISGGLKLKIIDALTGVKNSELAKFLLKNIRREKDLKIKLSQIRFIGQSGCSEAIPTLKNILRVEKNSSVRKELVLAIARLKK